MEILNIYSTNCAPTLIWVIWGALILTVFLIGYVSIFRAKDKFDKTQGFVLLSAVFVLFIVYSFKLFTFTEIRYEVKIDETVSAQELVKDWEIIEQKEDNIWILEKKEN